jgi:DNA-binding CsgD family transcriptional regulator/PAS domain-containing protein
MIKSDDFTTNALCYPFEALTPLAQGESPPREPIAMPTFKDLILQPQLNAVIRALYQASADPQAWVEALRQLAALTGAPFAHAVLEGDEQATLLTHSEDTADAGRYREHCEAWLIAQRAPKRLPSISSAFGDDEEDAGDAPFTAPTWSAPLTSASLTCAVTATNTASARTARLCIQYPPQRGADSVNINEVFSLLQPHLRATLEMTQALSAKRTIRSLLAQTLDVLPHGVFVIDNDGALLEANSAARSLLDARAGISLDDHQRVHATLPATDALLHDALRAASPSPLALHLARPSLPALEAILIPLTRSPRSPLTLSLPEPRAFALLLHDPQRDLSASVSARLTERFNLTDAEQRVADALLRGLPLPKVASSLRISQATARTHSQRIYQKVGVNDHADLLLNLLSSVWTLRDPRADSATTKPPPA